MKKLFAIALAAILSTGAFAQGFGSRMADTDFAIELGESPFYFQPVSYIHFGFNSVLKAPEDFTTNTNFFKSRQFGFNILELGVKPYEGGMFSIGADVEWNWFHLNSDYMFVAYNKDAKTAEPGGNHLSIQNKADMGITTVKRSAFSVCTFEFPLNFTQNFGRFTILLGASAELNLPGIVAFKGTIGTDNIDERKSGTRFSNKITTNLFTYNVHAAFGYGGFGFFVKYRPKALVQENFGPQFQTLTVGLIAGLGF